MLVRTILFLNKEKKQKQNLRVQHWRSGYIISATNRAAEFVRGSSLSGRPAVRPKMYADARRAVSDALCLWKGRWYCPNSVPL